MIRAALILALLTGPAHAATFEQVRDGLHCWAYPHHERCRLRAPAEPVQAPVVAPPLPPVFVPPAPVAVPAAPPVAAPVVVPAKPVKATRVKPKYKPAPIRKRVVVTKIAAWCARVPKGTTMGQIELAAPLWGVKLTAANRRQARACLASKGA